VRGTVPWGDTVSRAPVVSVGLSDSQIIAADVSYLQAQQMCMLEQVHPKPALWQPSVLDSYVGC
jgi:hypothetical protein